MYVYQVTLSGEEWLTVPKGFAEGRKVPDAPRPDMALSFDEFVRNSARLGSRPDVAYGRTCSRTHTYMHTYIHTYVHTGNNALHTCLYPLS